MLVDGGVGVVVVVGGVGVMPLHVGSDGFFWQKSNAACPSDGDVVVGGVGVVVDGAVFVFDPKAGATCAG